jgi:hypothetical protein
VDVQRNKVGSLKKKEESKFLFSMIVITLETSAPAKRRVIIPCHSYQENK